MTIYNKFASFAKRTFAVAASVAAMAFGTSALAAPEISDVMPVMNKTSYAIGENIQIVVILTAEITSTVSGSPYLSLNICNADGQSADAAFIGSEDEEGALIFSYKVRPGDTIYNLDATAFNLNLASINTADGKVSAWNTAASLPMGTDNAHSLVRKKPGITIRTITYGDGTIAKTGESMQQLQTRTLTITRGGTSTVDQLFTVSCSPAGAVVLPESFKIPAGAVNADLQFTAAQENAGNVTITIRPDLGSGYTSDDTYADITYTIPSITAGPKAFVFAENNDVTLSKTDAKSLNQVMIPVVRNGSTASEQVFSVTIETASGQTHIKNPPTSFSIPAGETTANFTFTPSEQSAEQVKITLTPIGAYGAESALVLTLPSIAAGEAPFAFTQTGNLAYTLNGVKEGDEPEILISRLDGSSDAQVFTVTATSGGSFITKPNSFTLAAGEMVGTYTFTANDMTDAPVVLKFSPAGFAGGTYDLTLTLPNISAAAAQKISLSKVSAVDEGSESVTLAVSLPVAPKAATQVKLEISDPSKMKFQTGEAGSRSYTFDPGETEPWEVTLKPLDGSATVTITATTTSGAYLTNTREIDISNVNPTLISPTSTVDNPWDAGKGGEGFPFTVSWSGTDVDADKDTLYVIISWGDGNNERYDGATGSAEHVYDAAGQFGITITMYDKDGGATSVAGTVEITPGVSVLINEYKYRIDTDAGQNAYKGLQGLGRGTVDDTLATTVRTMITEAIDWEIKYAQTQRSVSFTATPESFTITEKDEQGNPVDHQFDSFFHVWMGECFASPVSTVPIAPVASIVNLGDGTSAQSQNIGGVFAREHYPEDGCADIDFDGLPDVWEMNYFGAGSEELGYPFENLTGDFGEHGNPDNDFLPAGAVNNEMVVYPLDGGYTPNGIEFSNVYEVRGFHHGLNKKPDGFGWAEPSMLPNQAEGDEPHMGKFDDNGVFTDTDTREFYGTDPTNPDTDGDGYLDGYEYYWWRVIEEALAGNLKNAEFKVYNPAKVIEGEDIDIEKALLVFHPLIPARTGLAVDDNKDPICYTCGIQINYDDLDGDGLSNYEEMLLGTNPLHWDTDGDKMNDGWEVMWGLNPFDPKDAIGNPDGDFMAAYGADMDHIELRHSEVYKTFGYDARTAWNQKYKERHRTYVGSDDFSYSPNTMPFINYEEYYLGRWCIDKGITAAVEPMSKEFMTQPVPDTQVSYFKHNGFDRKGIVLNEGAYSADGSNSVVSAGAQIDVPPVRSIFQSVITTHGCDSDNDGMPDGWELYLCCGTGEEVERAIWPTGENWDQDATYTCDFDELTNIQECHGTELCEYYVSIYTNFAAKATSDINHNVNGSWFNKWWPTDPWNEDTDCDGLTDSQEGEKFRYVEQNCEDLSLEAVYSRYSNTTMKRGHIPGAGLNPCSVDTDMDYLPDFFEFQYAGFNRVQNEDGTYRWEGGYADQHGYFGDAVAGVVYGGGMDGTYFDSRDGYDEFSQTERNDFDFDHDGLQNYQEYWINGMFHFQYDKWTQGLDYGDYDPQQIFATGSFAKQKALGVYWKQQGDTIVAFDMPLGDDTFDWAYFAENWQCEGNPGPTLNPFTGERIFPFYYMPPEIRPFPFGALSYASSDPRIADSDGDNMDDYWEMFHGLNPILSDTADICNQAMLRPEDVYDFNKCPWLAGMPNADPDQDGKANWEEAISPNQPAAPNHNTDPSPIWFTDISWSHSFVNLYYNFGTAANYWAPESDQVYEFYPDPSLMWDGIMPNRPNYVFSFEMNEGFDTDNDNLSDSYEINGTSGGVTDPQDPDRPVGRKALYLDGKAAARTRGLCAFGKNALRSWTIEAWIRPEEPASGKRQVILDRPVTFEAGSSTPAGAPIRHTFVLGIEADGKPFVEFDSGSDNKITECASAGDGFALEADKWCHLAATFDGFQNRLRLYVNGQVAATKSTSAIPYTGFTYSTINGVSGSDGYAGGESNRVNLAGMYSSPRWSPVVVGARDDNPTGKVDGGYYYNNGAVYDMNNQPALAGYFKGWVDEVRVWTGARPGGEEAGDKRVAYWGWPTIRSDYDSLKRYGSREVLASREDTVKYFQRVLDRRFVDLENEKGNASEVTTNDVTTTTSRWFVVDGLTFDEYYDLATAFLQMSGGEDQICRVPPQLLCCYNFDNLPDPDYEPVAPAKFATLNGRPTTYNGAPWLVGANDRTTVYAGTEAPYCFQHNIENLVATMPLGFLVENGKDTEYQLIRPNTDLPLYKYRSNRVVNSKFWTRDAKGGIPLEEIPSFGNLGEYFQNNFKNTSNPYGMYYVTANYYGDELHPTTMAQETFDPVYSVMYNHLIPLRSAKADMKVQLWDDPNGTGLGVHADSDGDGLPDWWEMAYGMDPFNSDENGNGVPDAFDDFDHDGLSNISEYKAGTNPYIIDTDGDGIPDYEDNSAATARMNGTAYSDNDYLDDAWEQKWDDQYASTIVYDEHLDRDLDGWDNWSEQLYGWDDPNYSLVTDIPVPDINLTVTYFAVATNNIESSAVPLLVYVYSDRSMPGAPDAIYQCTVSNVINSTFTTVLTKAELKSGHVRQGRNWFMVSATSGSVPDFTAFGVNDDFIEGVDIGWDRNELRVALTEELTGYVRYMWNPSDRPPLLPGRRQVQIFAAGGLVFDKYIPDVRPWVTEADIIDYELSEFASQGLCLGLDYLEGNQGTFPAYQLKVDGLNVLGGDDPKVEDPVYYNELDDLLPPMLLAPVNSIVYDARLEFMFRVPREATVFEFELHRGSANGTQIYKASHMVPGRYNYSHDSVTNDLVRWQFPYCVGDVMPNGTVFTAGNEAYYWKVTASGPFCEDQSTEFASFRVATSATAGNKKVIRVKVRYPGRYGNPPVPAAFLNGSRPKIRVQAFKSASFNGKPAAELCIGSLDETAVLCGLNAGDYYVRAFVDQDNNYLRSNWESWGYYRDEQGGTAAYMPKSITADADAAPITITIRDADTDNDNIPDAMEYIQYKAASGHGNKVPADDKTWNFPQSWLGFSGPGEVISSPGYTDFDGDGLNDFAELNFGSDPFKADSDGDGINDYLERLLGFNPNAPQKLSITSFNANEDGTVSINWAWGGLGSTATRSAATATTLASSVTYVIEYTDSLQNPDWKVLDTKASVSATESATVPAAPKTRFYRVRIYTE